MLDVRGFRKWYGTREVLAGIDLRVEKGETVGLIGASGCGKSTLLRHVARLEDAGSGPVKGEILVDGADILRTSERELLRQQFRGKRVGMVFQHSALFDFLSVERNITWPLVETGGLSPGAARLRAKECLQLVEMPADARFLGRDVAHLSGGERKRVALARTIALKPELVLYDEPTTGLDPPAVTEINGLINRLKRAAGITAILTSHDMRATLEVADRIALLRDGRIAFAGPAAAALEDAEVRRFIDGKR